MLRDTHHGKLCPYCHRTMDRGDRRLSPTRDHVVPKVRGGQLKIICCLTCNGVKADMMPEVWAEFMAAHPGWWLLSRVELRAIHRKARGLVPRNRVRHLRVIKRNGIRVATVIVPPQLVYFTAAATAQPERKNP